MSSEVAVFEVSRIPAYLEMAFELLVACPLLLLASYIVGEVNGFVPWLGALAIYGAAGIFLIRIVLRLRYHYMLNVHCVVRGEGIAVEEHGAQKAFKWSEIAKAEYLPIVPAYRLWAAGRSRAVFLLATGGWPGGRVDRRNGLAANLLKAGLGNHLMTRWLPW